MRVLLVDHDSEGLEAIARAIRGVLELDCVSSKGDALLLLRQNTYDVLIACERCVDGSGLDLLGRTTRTVAPLKRIFAAAPERLQLLGPRLAPFKVQRTINYPIDLEELWLAIAQVTSGPDDGTDGTIERVVLDERGIPSTGTTPRGPIPPRPPAPLANVPPPPPPATAVSTAASGRYATARVTQPAPEPPLRAPAPPRQPPPVQAPAPSDTGRMRALAPPTPSDTGRMRALAPPPATTSDTGRMRALAPPIPAMPPMPAQTPAPVTNGAAGPAEFPAWTPEPIVADDLASVAEQARFGVQQKAVDEASRRKRTRLLVAGGVAIAVAGLITVLIRTFYDPEARAREQAIAVEKTRMAEQTKLSDNLTRIEIDIEKAIMENRLDEARGYLATLLARSPDHPRRDFLQDAIDRAEELAKLAGKSPVAPVATQPVAAAAPPPRAAEPRADARARPAERAVDRTPDRTRQRDAERTAATPGRQTPAQTQRTFGAPIGEQPRQAVIPLNAPINATPSTSARTADNTFRGRTIEASDSRSAPATPAYVPPVASAPSAAGSATPASPPAQPAESATDVTPAKLVKRVAPVAPLGVPSKTAGFVLVRYTIGDNGRVSDIEVVESSPAGAFDDAAQTAVRKWVYEPRKENGVAVASKAQARLVFEAQ